MLIMKLFWWANMADLACQQLLINSLYFASDAHVHWFTCPINTSLGKLCLKKKLFIFLKDIFFSLLQLTCCWALQKEKLTVFNEAFNTKWTRQWNVYNESNPLSCYETHESLSFLNLIFIWWHHYRIFSKM